MPLAIVERALRAKQLSYKVFRTSSAAADAKSTWIVCETNPAPRTHLESGTTIRLTVAPSCK
ncbi:MAG: hypothetical protein H0X28_00900 [Solirubrobacterales bacterium]|nr:hypothetical protein [Solirubrobacterales bacterium]